MTLYSILFSLTGPLFGYVLGSIAKEELAEARKYLHVIGILFVIGLLSIFIVNYVVIALPKFMFIISSLLFAIGLVFGTRFVK